MAFLAASRGPDGAATLYGFRSACVAALGLYGASLIMPMLLVQGEARGTARKLALPPLHTRRGIALHSLILAEGSRTDLFPVIPDDPEHEEDLDPLMETDADDDSTIKSSAML